MQRIVFHEHGSPDVLRLETLPQLQPAHGQVLVSVRAAGVNFFDTQARSGLYPRELPSNLGTEGAGIVEAVGEGVQHYRPGQRVAWILAPGSYATHVLVPAHRLVPLPEAISFEDAAATLYQALTAHYLACSTFPLGSEHLAVVHSAAGGVGGLLSQIARRRGATVIGTVSSEAKRDAALAAGCAQVVVYPAEDFAVAAKASGPGADVVYDAVGLDTFEQSLAALRPRGYLVMYGEASGLVPPLDVRQLLRAGSVFLTRTGLDSYITNAEQLAERAADIFAWMADGSLNQTIGARFPLADAAAAHAALETRKTVGKVLLVP